MLIRREAPALFVHVPIGLRPGHGELPGSGLRGASGRDSAFQSALHEFGSGRAPINEIVTSVPGGPYVNVKTGVASTSYIDGDLASGLTYYYVVSAENAAGESPNSDEAAGSAK